MDIIKFQKAVFEKNKLTIHDSITVDEWKQLGQSLKQVEGSVQFWIGDWARYGDKRGFTGKYTDPKVYDELEEITGLDRGTLQQYKWVGEATSCTRVQDLGFAHHREVAKLPVEKQEEFLKKASDEKLSVRDLREEIRKDEKNYMQPLMPSGKYRIIYADPPWKYNDECENGAIQSKGAQHHYPTMTIDELCSIELPEIEHNAVLFLWTTSPLLEDSFKIIKAWGFKYKTSFVWDKVKHNMGHYNSVRHEFLLICTKGSCTPDNMKLFDSVQTIEKTNIHSQKPEEFRNIIDTLYPNGKRIELFSRVNIDNWDRYGNELL